MELSQNPKISSDERTKGFDLSAGKTWIYPDNYPVRDYQFNIVQACLYSNTLVCLPTGLGKTFIAAVVMYNFWRWYPCGKIIFLAPTKPLVAQQIFACHNIMGIPSAESIELTGTVGHKQREIAWSKKRAIFATPQVFHNDLDKNIVPSDLVKCVVIDEAHKALGKHSYCECIRILRERTQTFRVLALSATPGNKIDNVHEVLQNLLIAHVELRDETSLDIVPYINKRKVDIILVPLSDKLAEYKDRYIFIMDRHVKILLQYNILRGHTANISKGRIFHLLKEYQKKTNKSGNYGQIIKTLNILMTMYHAYELMIRDGLRAFYKFYQNHLDKFWLNEEPQLQTLLEDIKTYLGPFPDTKTLCEGATTEISENLIFGHTKFDKLKELLLCHFKNSQETQSDTRAIVFVEYRDIVSEIYVLLLQCQPLIKPQMFVGQAGQKQKQQIKALENFKNNCVNVLISTSIGEEGLDVGEVDLIICFDVSQHSPTRLVQRMGRTGRKRDGHIVILVTDGREHETLKSTMARRDSLNHKILNTSNIFSSLYQDNPRMIPDIFTPECLKMHIRVQPKSPVTKNKNGKSKSEKERKKRQNTLKGMASTGLQKDGTKFSMMEYLKSEQGIFNSEVIQSSNARNTIKLSDVKILTCDNDAVDFLTTCALKISEEEGNVKNECKIYKSYVPKFPPIKHFFDFSTPDIKILNCLATLSDIVLPNYDKNELDNGCESNNEYDSFINESVFENAMAEIVEKCIDGESKFEDLLDDSSKSNESDLTDNGERTLVSSTRALAINSERFIGNDVLETLDTGNRINTLQSLKPFETSKFEDILNETSDDSETSYTENFEQNLIKNTDINNDIEVKHDNFKGNDNAYLQEGTFEVSDYFSPVSVKNCVEGDKRSNRVSKFSEFNEKRTFTITQAIDEIARLNSNSLASKLMNESEDDMFEDESVLQTEKQSYVVDQEIDGSVKYRSEENFNKLENISDRKNVTDAELKVEEYEWDNDFEISLDPVQDHTKFEKNTLGEKSKSHNSIRVESNTKTCLSDAEEWISVEKSTNTSKQNDSCTSIAKKLVNMKKCWNSRYDCFKKHPRDKDDCTSDDRLSIVKEKTSDFSFNESNNDFDAKSNSAPSRRRHESERKGTKYFRKRNRDKKLRNRKNEFICYEAEVSSNEGTTTDENSESDTDLEGFVSNTENVHDTSDMYIHYLQTVKSPMKRQDGFLFKRPRTLDSNIEIYSQPVTEVHESYINDSFCIADENIDQEITVCKELTELEKAERKLERRKRKRTCIRNKESGRNKGKNKRRNVINYFNNNSSSSEDETERLREQIKDESLLLKRS